MTAYVLAANANLRDIGNASIWGVATARTGGDTIDTNGFKLTIDQDLAYGKGGGKGLTFGNLTINAAKGGEIHVDGRYCRLIPYNAGSGTFTAGGLITCGGATGYIVGTFTAPANDIFLDATSGFIKVAAWNGVPFPTSGTFTQAGGTFTITGADSVGTIEIRGDEGGTIYANRLGTFRVTGEWFKLGTTSGVSNQTIQIPMQLGRYAAGIYIEKNLGAKDYEFYPNAGTTTTTGTEATRGKVCWINNTGLIRIGNSGAAANGYVPPAGLEIVIGNIFFENNTTAARTANVIPNATIGSRYDFTCTGGGVIEIDKCNMAWYLSCSQAYSVNVSNSGFIDGILLSEVASPMTFSKVGVGNKPTTALLMSPLTMTYCFAGGTFTDCVWSRVSMAATGAHTNTLTDIAGFTFVRDTIRANTIRGHATTYALNSTRIQNCTWTNPTIIQGAMVFTTCANVTVTDTIYCEAVSGTTVTTYSGNVWVATANSINCNFYGLSMPVANTHPYTSLLGVSVASANIKMRNIGTRAAPVTMGSVNACGLIYTVAKAAQDVKIQRVYCSNTRTGIMTGDNSCTRITEENVFGDYADAVDVMAVLNMKRKGMGGTGALTAQTSVYGTHWSDGFTSTTAGRIVILMNEPTASTTSQVTLTNGANFTSAGGLYMPTVGMTAIFETPEYIIGHTGFSATAGTMAGGTVGNYTFGYSIDKNDGAGWGALTSGQTAAQLATAMNAITGINAASGFKLRIKITTGTTNATAITSFFILTTSTTTAQDYKYPLDQTDFTFTVTDEAGSPVNGYEYRLYLKSLTDGVIGTVELDGSELYGSASRTFQHQYSSNTDVELQVIKEGYEEFLNTYTLNAAPQSVALRLRTERNI